MRVIRCFGLNKGEAGVDSAAAAAAAATVDTINSDDILNGESRVNGESSLDDTCEGGPLDRQTLLARTHAHTHSCRNRRRELMLKPRARLIQPAIYRIGGRGIY